MTSGAFLYSPDNWKLCLWNASSPPWQRGYMTWLLMPSAGVTFLGRSLKSLRRLKKEGHSSWILLRTVEIQTHNLINPAVSAMDAKGTCPFLSTQMSRFWNVWSLAVTQYEYLFLVYILLQCRAHFSINSASFLCCPNFPMLKYLPYNNNSICHNFIHFPISSSSHSLMVAREGFAYENE